MEDEMTTTITEEVAVALKAFAEKYGRQWKSELRRQWEAGGTAETEGVLHRLRNTHGPRWLSTYKLPA
jgi:hypothetical protein